MNNEKTQAEHNGTKKGITLIRPELLEIPEDGSKPFLKGFKCSHCGHLDFPAPSICPDCWHESFETVQLSRYGKVYAFSEIFLGQPTFNYPMIIGYVDLPEDIRVFSQFEGTIEDFHCDDTVEVIVGIIGTNAEGLPVSSYKFKKTG
jgi:uncharacterized OB-fold protein